MIRRRHVPTSGLAAAGALAAPRLRAQPARVLRFIPQVDLVLPDPTFASFYVTRNHGYMVFDTLYGLDGGFTAQPQMVSACSAPARRWPARPEWRC